MSKIAQADQDYSPGDVIIQLERPLVSVTKYEHRLFTCDQCMMRSASSIVCPACQKVYYCGRECQDAHWDSIHRFECPIFCRHKPLQFETNGIDYMQRLALRLYLLMVNVPETCTKQFRLHNGLNRCLNDMEYHPEQLKNTAQFQGILNYFKLYKMEDVDSELLLRVYGILHVNSFGIDCYYTENEENDIEIAHSGSGLYVEASVFDHNCVPNATASGDGLLLEIRALSPIKKGDQIYIDYLQDVLCRNERMTILQERYFFRCQCEHGCSDQQTDPFDKSLDFKRYSVLDRLIDSILERSTANKNSGKSDDSSTQNDINWSQLCRLLKERLHIRECYYAMACYHPTLSLFYREYLRFLLVNRHRFNVSINQCPPSTNNATSLITVQEIEQDMIEFGTKAKKHLAITHGIKHSFYSRLFPTL